MKHFQQQATTFLLVTAAIAAVLAALYGIEQLVSAMLGGGH